MKLPIYQIDAFTDKVFRGNPAAIVPLTEDWLDDETLQAIAEENNLSETAYFLPDPEKGEGAFKLRWFTPGAEVDLCGHATLAAAHLISEKLQPGLTSMRFETRSGTLGVEKRGGGLLEMDFPAAPPQRLAPDEEAHVVEALSVSLGVRPDTIYRSSYLLAVFEEHDAVLRARYRAGLEEALAKADSWGLIISAAGRGEHDFISRFFAPAKGVPEDPVTGSAHCVTAPYWAKRLGKGELSAFQASRRGGIVQCTADPEGRSDRVQLAGRCAFYLEGTIHV